MRPRVKAVQFELTGSPRPSPVFSLAVLVTLGLFAFTGVILLRPELIGGLLGHDISRHVSQHFRLASHRVHDLTFSFLIGTAGLGTFVQVRRPSQNFAGQLMALIPWVALALAFLLSGTWIRFAPAPIFAALTLLAVILHPGRGEFSNLMSGSRVSRLLLALAVVAAVPLLVLAAGNVRLQRAVLNDHALLGHYAFMAAFAITVIGVSLVASLRGIGWRLTAWTGGLLPVLLGLTSLGFPTLDSSLKPAWAFAAIAWGVAFVAAAEFTRARPGAAANVEATAR